MGSSLERSLQAEEERLARIARNPGVPEPLARRLDEDEARTTINPITGRYTPPQPRLFGEGFDDPDPLWEKVTKLPLALGKSMLESVDFYPEIHGGAPIPMRARAARVFNLATLPLPIAAPFKVAKGASLGMKALAAAGGSAVMGGASAAIEGAPVMQRAAGSGAIGAAVETGLSLLTKRNIRLRGLAAESKFFEEKPVPQAPDLSLTAPFGQKPNPWQHARPFGQGPTIRPTTRPTAFDADEWAFTPVSMTQPGKQLSREANMARKQAASDAMNQQGRVFTKLRGKRAGSTKPDAVALVHGIDDVEAMRLAKDFDQDWVVTKRGRYDLTNQTVEPITKVKYDAEVAPTDDYVEMLVDGKLRKASFEFGQPQSFNPKMLGQPSRFFNYTNKADLDFLKEPSIHAKMNLKLAQALRYIRGTEAAEKFLGAREAGLDLPTDIARLDFTGNADDAVSYTGVNSLADRTKKLFNKSLKQIITDRIKGSEIDKFDEFLIAQYRLAADDVVKNVQRPAGLSQVPAFGQATGPNLSNVPAFGRSPTNLAQGLTMPERVELQKIVDEARKNAPHFDEVASDYYKWWDAHLQQLKESKAITEEELNTIRTQTGGRYTPIRNAEAREEDSVAELMELFGRPVDYANVRSSVQESIRDSYNLANINRRAMTSNAFIQMLRSVGPELASKYAVPINSAIPDGSKSLIDVVRGLKAPVQRHEQTIINGLVDEFDEQLGRNVQKRVWYKITDPAVAEMYHAMLPHEMSLAFKLFEPAFVVAKTLSSVLRAGATLSPNFMAKNPARDLLSGKIMSNTFIRDFVSGVASVVTKDEKWLNALRSGAFRAEMLGQDVKVAENLVRRWTNSRPAGEKLLDNVVKSPLDALRALSNSLEQGNRLGAFNRRYSENIAKGMSPDRASRDAAIHSKDAFVDFGMFGSRTAPVRLVTAFWGAMTQSYWRMQESALKDPAGFLRRATGYITVPSILFYLHNRQDPEYRQLPSWERNMFWHFKATVGPSTSKDAGKQWIRIPKPFDLGIVFGSAVERMLESLDDNDPRVMDEFAANYAKSAGFDMIPIPTAARPLLENYINKSFLRQRPIVSKALEDVEPRYQIQPQTSQFAAFLGDMFNMSPVQIDNVISGYTGGLGRLGTDALSTTKDLGRAVFDANRTISQSLPSFDPQTIPGLQAFLSQFPRNAEPIDKLYDFVDKARKASETSDYLEKSLRIDDLMDWIERKGMMAGVFNSLTPVTKALSDLRAQRARLYSDESLSPREQRKQMEELDRQMLEIASTVYDAVKQFERPQ